jgi:selenide,water dikinase
LLDGFPEHVDPNLLVGHATSDDAGVYRIADDLALVLSVDFFPPIVDDPFDFGRIAAANALSDLYAMGARPTAGLNIAAFPENTISYEVLGEILRGGSEVARRAGMVVVGGHTVKDSEIKYGLVAVGTIHPDHIVTNAGARPGDELILTKPLGTGILSTALRMQKLDDEGVRRLTDVMTTLNDIASERMREHAASACKDVTGFGLAGHALEMAQASAVTIEIDSSSVPLIDGALDCAKQGYLTGGGKQNRSHVEPHMALDPSVDEHLQHLLFDAQTSGGLLIAVAAERCAGLLASLVDDYPQTAVIGACVPQKETSLVIG